MKVVDNNIWLAPRDVIHVEHKPRSFTALGAVNSQSLQQFKTEQVTLAEALAQTGGLNSNIAHSGAVFIFRYESAKKIALLEGQNTDDVFEHQIPTVYQLDLSQPQALFFASYIKVSDKDIIYVAQSPGTEFQKFVSTIVSPLLRTTNAAIGIVN